MSLQVSLIAEESAYNSPTPFSGARTANVTPGGSVTLDATRASYGDTIPSHSPQAGIAYIDQAVGGISTPRGDTRATGYGFRSRKQRVQPFNGDYIGGATVVNAPKTGEVGLNRNNTAARIMAAGRTNLPDPGETRAAFMNPALVAAIGKIRGNS